MSFAREGFEFALQQMRYHAARGIDWDLWFGMAMGLMEFANGGERWEFQGAANEAHFLKRRARERRMQK